MTGHVRYSMKITGFQQVLKSLENYGADAEQAVYQTIAEATLLAKEIISDYITTVGLVDTGFYRENWIPEIVEPGKGRLMTNTIYALLLEFGFHGEVSVKAHKQKMKGHKVRRHKVKTHTRRMKNGKTVKVKAHWVKAHRIKPHVRNRKAHTRQFNRRGFGAMQHTAQAVRRLINDTLKQKLKELQGR